MSAWGESYISGDSRNKAFGAAAGGLLKLFGVDPDKPVDLAYWFPNGVAARKKRAMLTQGQTSGFTQQFATPSKAAATRADTPARKGTYPGRDREERLGARGRADSVDAAEYRNPPQDIVLYNDDAVWHQQHAAVWANRTAELRVMPYKRAYRKSYGRTGKSYARGTTKAFVSKVATRAIRRQVEVKQIAQVMDGATDVPDGGVMVRVNNGGPCGLVSPNADDSMLNCPIAGVTWFNRIGRKIREVSLEIVGQVRGNAAAFGNSDCVRLIVLRDLEGVGAAPAAGDFLTNGLGLPRGEVAVQRTETMQRFKFLFDGCIPLNMQAPAQVVAHPFRIFLKLNKLLQFDTTLPTQIGQAGSLKLGGIWFFAISDTGANYPNVACSYRFRYRDA